VDVKQTLYLHIGYHKTGTTSLQSLLDQNATALRGIGVYYPDTVGDGKRNYFHKHLQFFIDLKTAHDQQGDIAAPVRAMARLIQDSGAPTTIVSEESFSGLTEAVLDRLADLRADFTVKVVAVLRRQDKFLQSFYQQAIRDFGEKRDFPDFIRESKWQRIHYDTAMTSWADRFGAENIHVLSYDLCDGGNSVIPSVLNILLEGRRADFLDMSRAWNTSVPTICYETLKYVNRSAAPEAERRAVFRALSDYVKSKAFAETRLGRNVLNRSYLTEEISQSVANAFAESNARTSALFFGGANPFPGMPPPTQTGEALDGLTAAPVSFLPKDMIGLLSYVLISGKLRKPAAG
jgi:hypothetical protein